MDSNIDPSYFRLEEDFRGFFFLSLDVILKKGNEHVFFLLLFLTSMYSTLSSFFSGLNKLSREEMTSYHSVVPMPWLVLNYEILTLDLKSILAIGAVYIICNLFFPS